MNNAQCDTFYEANKGDLKNMHDSKLSNEEIFKQLEIVDSQSALKIHPNDRRKICRYDIFEKIF